MSLLRKLWLVVSGLIGALFGALLMFLFAGLNTPLLLGAAAGALVYGGLWWQQTQAFRRGQHPAARRLKIALTIIPLIFVALLSGLAALAAYNAGQIAVPTSDWLANFDRLWLAIHDNYPYFDIKGVDPDALCDRYRPLVEAAADDAAYHALVADMLAELNDAHTFIDPFPVLVWQFGSLSDIGGQAVVSALDKTAQAAGLAVGDVLLTINGLNIEDAVAALPPRLRVSSTPWSSRAWALDNLLALWDGTESLTITALDANGEKTVILTPPDRPEADINAPVITGERLPSGLGLIRIPRFWGSSRAELAAQFDAALEPLQDTPGLILDIRGNGGGSSLTAAEMAGRFLDSPFIYAREYYRQRLSVHFWLPFGERIVYPRGPLYDGRLVLLTDARVLSSAEEFVLMLTDSERASLVGRVTGGGSGNPLVFPLTGDAEARFSSGDLRRISGERLEGAGISPDVAVTWTVDDLRAGRDPDIAAAESLLAQNG